MGWEGKGAVELFGVEEMPDIEKLKGGKGNAKIAKGSAKIARRNKESKASICQGGIASMYQGAQGFL